MDQTFTFTVNGKARSVTTDPERSLLEVLREEFQITGPKYGCGEGQCRACTVLVNGESITSCVTPVSSVDKHDIVTIEGLTKGDKLHPVQEQFIAHDALQCGFCTPGMIMSCAALLEKNKTPSLDDVKTAVSGNLCRCGTYPKIFDAVLAASKQA